MMRKRTLMLAMLGAFMPMMIVQGDDGGDAEKIKLDITNNGKHAIDVAGLDEPLAAGATKELELDDVGGFTISHATEDDGGPADGEGGRALLELRNKSNSVLTLIADGVAHPIYPQKGLSLGVEDLDTLELQDSSATATQSEGGQAGSTDTEGAADRSNTDAAGPEGDPAPEGAGTTGSGAGGQPGGYHDDAGKGPDAPNQK